MGCRKHGGGHKNNVCTNKNDTGPDLGPMIGEISPNIMFGKKTHTKKVKGVWTAPDGCTWVRMGAVGCICTGGAGQQR